MKKLISMAVFALLVTFVFAKQANAEYPNILVGDNLTVGSTGQGVVVLQELLTELGYMKTPLSVPFGYFGAITKDALARYQGSQNVSPAVGYFGPTTKIAMQAHFLPSGWLALLNW